MWIHCLLTGTLGTRDDFYPESGDMELIQILSS